VEWWPFVWMMVVLKVPLAAALWIIWWALRSEPATDEGSSEEDDGGRGPDHPRPRRPLPPRRGPHASPPPKAPRRVRARLRRPIRAARR
jgi:hypothetical protein